MSRTIASMQAKLRSIVSDWREDNSSPANYIRETGMGEEIGRVDRWCGGYQDVHKPIIIGWQARNGNQVMTGVVIVNDGQPGTAEAVDSAINKAKACASLAIFELRALTGRQASKRARIRTKLNR
jgi:hypothetical protein